tara:strand:+ start:322 stop:540 length:219 start_codon:yes stop_codon:yes gene_type:complete
VVCSCIKHFLRVEPRDAAGLRIPTIPIYTHRVICVHSGTKEYQVTALCFSGIWRLDFVASRERLDVHLRPSW